MTLNQATFTMIGKSAGVRWKDLKPTLGIFWGVLREAGFSLLAMLAVLVCLISFGIGGVQAERSAEAQKSTLIQWLQQAEGDRDKAKQELTEAQHLLANQQIYTDFLRQNPTPQVRSKKQKL